MRPMSLVLYLLAYNAGEAVVRVSEEHRARTGVGVTLTPEDEVLFAVSDTRPVVFTLLPPTSQWIQPHETTPWQCYMYSDKQGGRARYEMCQQQLTSVTKVVEEVNQVQDKVNAKYDDLKRLLYNFAHGDSKNPTKRAQGLIPIIGTGLSYLFGLSTGDQLETLRKHVIKTNENVKIAAEERAETLKLLSNLTSATNKSLISIWRTVHSNHDAVTQTLAEWKESLESVRAHMAEIRELYNVTISLNLFVKCMFT